MIEKKKLIFILISSKYISKFSECLCIRVPIIDKLELTTLVNIIIEQDNIKINKSKINTIIDKNNQNISLVLYNLFEFTQNGIDNNNYLDIKLDKILNIVYNNRSGFKTVRALLYELMSHNIDRLYILKYSFFKTLKYVNNNKHILLEFTNEINLKMCISFKSIIHIEYYMARLHEFIE